MNIIRTILIIVAVYYLLKFFTRLFAPQITDYAAKKMQEKFNQNFDNNYNRESAQREPEGKTTIVTKPEKKNNINSDKGGEYIDFEEIE